MPEPLRRARRVAHCALALVLWVVALSACGNPAPTADPGLPTGAGPDVAAKADGKTGSGDGDGGLAADSDTDSPSDLGGEALTADTATANTAPQWKPLAGLALDQGTTAQVDLNPLLFDVEDDDTAVTVSWSAQHVGLQDKANSHQLHVAAPTTWSGTETVTLTATDTGGLTATAALAITVNPVQAPPLKPNSACAPLQFAIAAGTSAKSVLLSGSFNDWGNTAGNADPMLDPDGDGTWSTEKKLAAGVYQYKFVVDGKWMADASNPNQVPDGFGGSNSVIEVAPCTP